MKPAEYENEFFRNHRFSRKVCKRCGSTFWSSGEREVCAETPCTPYNFIGASPFSRPFQVAEFQEFYLRYFEARGHTRVSRYPVVPRWRNDVFFVQASIYDFQPWVTSGAIEPPANPLTIAQPCLRFTDIAEVGVSQRHLTGFTMLAHHAFNKPGAELYFKDRTVELCHELFTRELGAEGDALTYKEEVWEGGGDMGPSLSVGIGGLEIATLVFMQYSKVGDVVRPLPMKVVDTGYGLERIVWVTQGTPTIYEAIFGDILRQLPAEFSPQESATMVDHARSLALTLTDGVVPSNVKEGYYARLLLRRILRILAHHPRVLSLQDLVARVVDHASSTLPELRANQKDIAEILAAEEDRFKETTERGRAHIHRLEERLHQEGKRIGTEDLLELYDSMGITPDIAVEELQEPVTIPPDFFAQVAKLHEGALNRGSGEAPATGQNLPPELPDSIPPSEVLYHQDPYTVKFHARVLWADLTWVVLDKTYFYPTGGGQITDTGRLGGVGVVEVVRRGPHVFHRLGEGATHPFTPGSEVEGSIDEERRRQLMQHHTATHLLNGALRQVLGPHVWQAGAYKGVEGARLDFTHYKGLTEPELAQVERIVNRVVREDREVKSYFSPRQEAEMRFGFTLYQGGAVPGKSLRIVEIEGFDVEACGGTHCTHTSEVGLVKVFSTERIQDGMVRLNFAAGERALGILQEHEQVLRSLSQRLATPPEKLPEALEAFTAKLRDLERATRSQSTTGVKALAGELLRSPQAAHRRSDGFTVIKVFLPSGSTDLKELARELTRDPNVVALLGGGDETKGYLFIASGSPDRFSAVQLLEVAKRHWTGKGGGNPSAATASGPGGSSLELALGAALKAATSP